MSVLVCVYACLVLFGKLNCYEYKVCDNIGTFLHFENKPLKLCADECSRRQRCKHFMFRKQMDYCALKEEVNMTSLQYKEPTCVFYTRDEWLQDDLGACRGQPCDMTERCYSKTETEYECLKSECTAPEPIQNAYSLSNVYSIGSTNRYKCSNGLIKRGNPTTTCLENATWSITDFRCVLPDIECPKVKLTFVNADISKVTKNEKDETVLTYTCKDGYKKSGDEINITCTSSGEWDAKHITCCPENTTHLIHEECVSVVDGGIVTSRTEAIDYCTEVSGRLQWIFNDYVHVFNTTKTRFILQLSTMSFLDSDNWFEKCMATNNIKVDSSLTLEEKMAIVRTDELKGKGCNWAYSWVPGQPDFIESEDCIFRDLSYDDKNHIDGNCDFAPNVGFACRFHTPKVKSQSARET